MGAYLHRTMPDGLFVVHTAAAYDDALRWLTPDRVLQLPWPAASIAEIAERFAGAVPSTSQEPHALLIGDARDAKGIHELLAALSGGGPLLRIVGQQPDGVESALKQRYPATRVNWETGWISRSRLNAAIGAASVVVFPYLKTFGQHGGVSGALAQALTFGKPLVVSSVLADQLPVSHALRIVEPGDVADLRHAVEWAVSSSAELHRAAASTFDEVCENHTYDRHLARIVARIAA
jgi:glycosyltransferase involved in cell wall biosynthesis